MSNKIVKFTDLLDCPKTLIANDLIVVNNDGSGLTEVSGGSIVPPFVGLGTMGDIPIWNDPLLTPPVFVDSGVGIGEVTGVFPFPIGSSGRFIDMNKNISPISNIVANITIPDFPNPDQHLLLLGANVQGTPGQDYQVGLINNSDGPQQIIIANNSNFGVGSDIYIGGAQNTSIQEPLNNNTMSVNDNGIYLQDNGDNNFIHIDNSGINISTNSIGDNINIYNSDGNNSVFMSSGGININNNNASQLTLNGGFSTLQGNSYVSLSETNDGHFINLQSNGIVIASNSLKDLSLNTDGQMHMKILSSTGNAGEVLTAQGDTSCKWDILPQYNYAYSCINAVPGGASWDLIIGTVPFDTIVSAPGYGGFTNSRGTSIIYNNVTSKWTVADAGLYNVLCILNVNVNNGIGYKHTNSRISLLNSALVQQGYDSGRFESSAGMSAAGILSYNIQFNFVGFLSVDDYTINVSDETGGGLGGCLIGKASCFFNRIG